MRTGGNISSASGRKLGMGHMSIQLVVALGALGMVVIIAAGYLAMLAFHDPSRSRWLRVWWVEDAVTFILVGAALFDFGLELKILVASGMDPLLAPTSEFAFMYVVAYVVWKGLHVAERLDAGRSGLSPFLNLSRLRDLRRQMPVAPALPCRPAEVD